MNSFNLVHIGIRDEPDPNMHIAIVVDLRCPKCTESFTVKIVEGFVRSNVKRGLTIADWSLVRQHALACFEAEHVCWGTRIEVGAAEHIAEAHLSKGEDNAS